MLDARLKLAAQIYRDKLQAAQALGITTRTQLARDACIAADVFAEVAADFIWTQDNAKRTQQ